MTLANDVGLSVVTLQALNFDGQMLVYSTIGCRPAANSLKVSCLQHLYSSATTTPFNNWAVSELHAELQAFCLFVLFTEIK